MFNYHNIRALLERLAGDGGMCGGDHGMRVNERAPPSPSKMPLIEIRLFEISSLAW